MPENTAKVYKAILAGGLATGILDISYAFVASGLRGIRPDQVLQSVASGLLGADAFKGGAPAAALGAMLHFVIALIWAVVYYVASRWIRILVDRPVVFGMLYGAVVYAFMNLVVVPLSAAPFKITFAPMRTTIDVAGHMLLVGLPIALALYYYLRTRDGVVSST